MREMKIKTSLFALLSLLFLSCSLDEDKVEELKSIFGTWNSISFIANEPLFDINEDGVNSLELLDELPCRFSKLILNEDFTFYQENNSWSYDVTTDSYSCTNLDNVIPVTGTWKINSDFSLLTIIIDGNMAFLPIEFDGETLMFNSSESFINRNIEGELKNIYGKVIFQRE